MAVQAQYPSNLLLLNRNIVEDSKDYTLQPQPGGRGGGFIEQSHMIFNNNGGGIKPRKRSRDVAAATTTVKSFNFSVQNQNQVIDLSQLQNHQLHQQQPNGVSIGLGLSYDDQNYQNQQRNQQNHQQQQQPNTFISLISEDLSLQFKQQTDEIFYFLQSQGEQLRRRLADKRERHYPALLGAAEEVVSRQMREKEAEVEKAAKRNAELEARAAQLSAEAQAWQSKARAQEAQAVSLQAQLKQAMVGPTNLISGDNKVGEAEDAESANVDSVNEQRVMSPSWPSCKMCRTRISTVVLLPCRHLCVCRECDGVVQACPLCLSIRSASVEVYLA